MKKILSIILVFVMLFALASPVMADGVKVKLGDEYINFDVTPKLINGRTMVPLRAIFEALGATVDWNEETETVTSTRNKITVTLKINSFVMFVDGEIVSLDSPACLVGGRTLVPVRAISEAFKLKVGWDDATQTVLIEKPVKATSVDVSGLTTVTEYDQNGNALYSEDSNGNWTRWEFDENGNSTYYEDSEGSWAKMFYDINDNMIYYENSNGRWQRSEFDKEGNLMYP